MEMRTQSTDLEKVILVLLNKRHVDLSVTLVKVFVSDLTTAVSHLENKRGKC